MPNAGSTAYSELTRIAICNWIHGDLAQDFPGWGAWGCDDRLFDEHTANRWRTRKDSNLQPPDP